MFEGHTGGSEGVAVYPESTRSEAVLVGILLATGVIRTEFVLRYAHASDRSKSGNEFCFALELCRTGGKGLEVSRKGLQDCSV